ncbi:MAG TPA: hypothetical protein IAA98_13415 [Candidatus Avipropionibacterium avicola]|uniref:Extracellular solute-binding protein n=1 Tax=Candidatus Avipropionibacterium avicola TaxID=2840701 RepID=A0A9D1KP80_9ACTN|nr:hypothetical protein [Candidatus Avipropionibacterium avicola]
MTTSPRLTRRTVLGSGLAAGIGLAAGCRADDQGGGATGGGESGSGGSNDIRPAYIPYDGPEPDLPGDGAIGTPAGFLSYPDPPQSTGRVPLELSAPVEMLMQRNPPVTPHSNNQWWQKIEADLGADLKINAVESTQYTAKFQTAVAGNSIGDLTQYVTVPQLPKLLEATFTDLTPYLSGDNVAKYPNLANHPSAAWDMCTVDGKIWGVTNPRVIAGNLLMTRGDVLESKGIDMMPDLSDGEDFLDLCKEVTDRSKGVFAIGQIPQNWTLPAIIEALGGPNGWLVNDDGTWTSQYETPEFAQALEIVTQMYEAGVFHPNSYTDLSATPTWFDAGATVLFAQNFAIWQGLTANAKFPCGAVVMPQWEGGGKAAKHLGAPGYGAPMAIKKTDDEDRIDELLRVLDYVASPFGTEEYLTVNYGIRDRQWTLVDSQLQLDNEAYDAELIPGLVYAGANTAMSLYSPGQSEPTQMAYQYCQDTIPNGVANPQYGRYSDTAGTKGAQANTKLNDLMGAIIQGRSSMTEWEDGVKQWKSAAGDAIAREYAEQG